MTTEEVLGTLMNWAESFGPWIIALYVLGTILTLAVFALAVTFIVKTWRRIDRDFDRMDRMDRRWRR